MRKWEVLPATDCGAYLLWLRVIQKVNARNLRRTFIAPDDLPFGIARMYEVISSETPENAHRFLGT